MSVPSRPYGSFNQYPSQRPTFIPRAAAPAAAAGGGSNSGSLSGLISGLGFPIVCLGCISAIALLGLLASMISAAVFMNRLQQEIQELAGANGTTIELNLMVLFSTLLCSIYMLSKHRRDVTST